MKKKNKIDIYMGGERDPAKIIIPKDLGKFFDKKRIILVFVILLSMLLIAGVSI
ncbi:MAG: hypothetical protein JW700_02380 [Candidatus Aenigmarchaeota archaeon]|nr:hypothetical protein [Candidatus Aenigmarchaeota archaeon]